LPDQGEPSSPVEIEGDDRRRLPRRRVVKGEGCVPGLGRQPSGRRRRPGEVGGFDEAPPIVPRGSAVAARLSQGHVVRFDDPMAAARFPAEEVEHWRDAGVFYFVPCVSKGSSIAVLAIGRRENGEPMTVLIQESLASIGIKAQINKIPGATWRAALLKKDMPMIVNRFGGWLDYPEYFFFWCYHSQDAVFNTMSYKNPALDKLITTAQFASERSVYEGAVKDMIQIAYDEVPRVPLLQPTMDVAMRRDVQGYMYWFHLQPDYRQLSKG
jgi:hypothetical protein